MNKWNLINADSGEKTWLTPKHIIDALGDFDTDPCCPDNMPWGTADIMLTKAMMELLRHGKAGCGSILRMVKKRGRSYNEWLHTMEAVLPLSSFVQTQSNGMNGYSLSRTRFCSCEVDCDSVTQTEHRGSLVLRRPHLWHILNMTQKYFPRAELKERL